MIDGYVLSHPQVVLSNDWVSIRDETITVHVFNIARDWIQPVDLDIFGMTRLGRVQSMHVELSVETTLAQYVQEKLNVAERLLLEVVVLHRLKELYENKQTSLPRAGRAVAIMGTMIQHRLTRLLLTIEPRQRARVFGLGRMRGLSQEHWKIEFIGAAAAARVVMGFHSIKDTLVRFPTIEEDVDDGIDLLVDLSSKNLQLAVNVKSVNREERIQAEHVTPAVVKAANGSASQLERIVQGTRALSDRYGRTFTPIRVLAGRPVMSNYTLTLMDEETLELERLLGRVERAGISRHGLHRVV